MHTIVRWCRTQISVIYISGIIYEIARFVYNTGTPEDHGYARARRVAAFPGRVPHGTHSQKPFVVFVIHAYS